MTKLFLFFSLLLSSAIYAQDMGAIDKKKPIKVFGSVGVGGWYYNRSGPPSDFRRVPFSWYLNGSPTVQIYNFTFPFSVTISEQQRDFSQPFNQYGCSPYYKFITGHFGYRSMNFSQYTLAGQTFLGAGLEINPKKLRIGVMYGRMRKAIAVDTINSTYTIPNVFSTYKRMGMAAKIGVGSKSNFVDLILFKGWDDEKSLSPDESFGASKPGDNLTTGIKANFTPIKNLVVDIDGGASLVTTDKTRRDSVGAFFNEIPSFLSKSMVLNYSTHLYLAGHTSITYRIKKFSIRAMYKYVQPDYQSFGSNYIQGDLRDITLSPSASFWKGKINLSATVGHRSDNLQNQKKATSNRTLLNANLNVNLSQKFGFGLNYGNFGLTQQRGAIILNDSIRISTINQNFGGNFRFQLIKDKRTQIFMLFVNYSNLNDRNEVTAKFTASQSVIGNFSFNTNYTKKGFGYSVNLSANQVQTAYATIQGIGPNIGVNKSLLEQKLKINLNTGYQLRFIAAKNDGSIVNVNSDVSYSLNKHNSCSLNIYAIFNNSSSKSIYSFNEQRVTLRYMYNF